MAHSLLVLAIAVCLLVGTLVEPESESSAEAALLLVREIVGLWRFFGARHTGTHWNIHLRPRQLATQDFGVANTENTHRKDIGSVGFVFG